MKTTIDVSQGLLEFRILAVQIIETGAEVSLSLADPSGNKLSLELHGVKDLRIDEMRQQNVVEELTHWTRLSLSGCLREAAFDLSTGLSEEECDEQRVQVAGRLLANISSGELEMIKITAIYGAELLASFVSMEFVSY